MARNRMVDMRDHLFEALERLKTGEIDVKSAKAMAEIGDVLVESAKVELQMMKQMGMHQAPTNFITVDAPKALLGQAPAQALLPMPDEPLEIRYGRCGKEYYARVLRRDRDGDFDVQLVKVDGRGLRGQIGAAIEQLPEYSTMDALESVMMKKPTLA